MLIETTEKPITKENKIESDGLLARLLGPLLIVAMLALFLALLGVRDARFTEGADRTGSGQPRVRVERLP